MAHGLPTDRDYRSVIIPRWVSGRIETFRPPSPGELAAQSRQFLPLIQAYLPPYRESAILEIGCGYGAFLRALVDEGYRNLAAIDLIPECCAFVKQHVGVEPQSVDLLTFLAKDEGRYDAIIAIDVIEHFTKNEIVAIVERLHEALNPGGVFIMRVPNGSSLGGLRVRYSGFTHETAFTPESVGELFKAMGFDAIACLPDPVSARDPVRGSLKRALRWASEQIISLGAMRFVDARFAVSLNVTGVGRKRYPSRPDVEHRGARTGAFDRPAAARGVRDRRSPFGREPPRPAERAAGNPNGNPCAK